MALAKLVPLGEEQPETYHGVPVLEIHVGDVILTPRMPTRYAVHVGPDLARYLLGFNHPANRNAKPRKIRAMAADIRAGCWYLTPQSLVFSTAPLLINGQNTLRAIIESGCMVWIVVDFGWPTEIVDGLDRGTVRTNADTLHFAELPNSSNLAAIATKVWQYDRLVGATRSLAGMDVPSSPEVREIVTSDLAAYEDAARSGKRVYERLDKGGSPSVWGTAYCLIAKAHPERVVAFFDEIAEETGAAGTSTRVLAQWFRRRPAGATKTGDAREPLELIIRAFNAWLLGKSFSFPKWAGFQLGRVRG
jgi:hypothetical protein